MRVLKRASYDSASDALFILGDTLDRGEDSEYTVRLMMDLAASGAELSLGNHELMAVAALFNEMMARLWLEHGGSKTLGDFGVSEGVALPDDVLHFFAGLPLGFEFPDCLLVHAGICPETKEQTIGDLLWLRWDMRGDYFGKRVIFGHTPVMNYPGHEESCEPIVRPNCIALDTGSCFGGMVTVMDIDSLEFWQA